MRLGLDFESGYLFIVSAHSGKVFCVLVPCIKSERASGALLVPVGSVELKVREVAFATCSI